MRPTCLPLAAGVLALFTIGCGRADSPAADSAGSRADSTTAVDSAARADSGRAVSAREERDPPCLASRFGLLCASEPEP
jgi:hypothetical protein